MKNIKKHIIYYWRKEMDQLFVLLLCFLIMSFVVFKFINIIIKARKKGMLKMLDILHNDNLITTEIYESYKKLI